MSILKPYIDTGKLVVVGPSTFEDCAILYWDRGTAKKKMEDLLKGAASGKTLHAVLAPNDNTAAAMIEALEADLNYAGKVIDTGFPIITGQDYSQEGRKLIQEGKLYMTVEKVPHIAKAAVELADRLIRGAGDSSIPGTVPGTRNNGKKDIKTYLVIPTAITKKDL